MVKFDLNARVEIIQSGEVGLVIAYAIYVASEANFLIRYKAADGRAVEAWWSETALKAVE